MQNHAREGFNDLFTYFHLVNDANIGEIRFDLRAFNTNMHAKLATKTIVDALHSRQN